MQAIVTCDSCNTVITGEVPIQIFINAPNDKKEITIYKYCNKCEAKLPHTIRPKH